MTALIQQRSGSDCFLAALAMARGVERWQDLWNDDHLAEVIKSRGVGDEEPWMNRAGYKVRVHYKRISIWSHVPQEFIRFFLWKRRAIVSVASLNNDEGTHAVYWDGESLYDPHEGHYPDHRAFKWLSSCFIKQVLLFDDSVQPESPHTISVPVKE